MRTSEGNFTKPEQNIIKAKIILHVEIRKFMQKSTREPCKKAIENLLITSKSDSMKFLNILNRYRESRTDSIAISIEDLYDFFKSDAFF